MAFTSRSRVPRWLRLALAVLALVAGQVSMVRAAVGTPRVRTGAVGEVVAALPPGAASSAATSAGTTSGAEAPHGAPEALAHERYLVGGRA